MSNNLRGTAKEQMECDVLVIGGGSGGMACAQATAKLMGSVIIADFVRPSETHRKTTWGFGGTCVNVGCVPKKLFHRAGFFGQSIRDGELSAFGFKTEFKPADWETVVTTVQNYVKMLNFNYRVKLPENCKYVKARAQFNGDAGPITLTKPNGDVIEVKVKKCVVIAVGGRPLIPKDIPGAAEFGISSDDLFSLPTNPGKTLVVGSSFIGLETSSFLSALGLDTTLVVRNRPLGGPGFDQDCADKVLQLMEASSGTFKVRRNVAVTKLEAGIVAHFSDGTSERFDTVLFATGRYPEVLNSRLGKLPTALRISPRNGKIQVDPKTFVACAGVYAIGDCAETGSQELTPVAVRQGELVAKHIAGQALDAKMLNSLLYAPTTVFALPSEYGRAGISEQEAIAQYGQDDVEVYWRAWEPLETSAAHANSEHLRAFVKMVCIKSQNERVVGMHLVTPTASEVIHGLALSMALGATKNDFDARVLGIHPTDAEGLCDVTVTKSSGLSFNVASGCGGGKCG